MAQLPKAQGTGPIAHERMGTSLTIDTYPKRYGYDNLGFYFDQRGVRFDDKCMATVHLPDYAISRIRVGQWISATNRTVWEAEFPVSR